MDKTGRELSTTLWMLTQELKICCLVYVVLGSVTLFHNILSDGSDDLVTRCPLPSGCVLAFFCVKGLTIRSFALTRRMYVWVCKVMCETVVWGKKGLTPSILLLFKIFMFLPWGHYTYLPIDFRLGHGTGSASSNRKIRRTA